MLRRTDSSSSDASHDSRRSLGSHESEDQFAFSPVHTPAKENPPPSRAAVPRYVTDPSAGRHGLLLGKVHTHPPNSENNSTATNDELLSPNSKSRPIAIDLPGPGSAYPTAPTSSNPTEPLSARGDIAGGYFPLHEDPESRVRVPHPFHHDADKARQSSLQQAAESSKCGTDSRPMRSSDASRPPFVPLIRSTSPSASPHTPVSSYMPSGAHQDVVLPLGKYYPTNWEKRHGKDPRHRPSTLVAHPTAPVRSEPQVPKYHDDLGSARPGSDVKRRLQQYQRDMVAQAAMAASAVLANSASTTSSAGSPSPGGLTLPAANLAAAFLKTHKPLSPRLRPVGSPGGPVTPMSLEGECYLTLRLPAAGSDAASSTAEAGDAMAAPSKETYHRRRDSRSSPVELGTVSV
ncbi:f0b84628-d742-4749-958a-a7fc5c770fe2 [Thermothielavioides terrestris]|uniref:F0b84628-d742-4749-958a-a7fc5c770fe2 n=1 Tax=Thermothielavioides terrestris TaxID=2587410 RepID=A0A446BB98_9PEZI|nr:f0b84628-d742-4749-958a-a7fc5c770fe2 [Thermothielavioides terrestris]